MLSLERNYILVKSYVIGGPDERILPPRSLMHSLINSGGDGGEASAAAAANANEKPAASNVLAGSSSSPLFSWPLFSGFPVPRDYMSLRPTNVVVVGTSTSGGAAASSSSPSKTSSAAANAASSTSDDLTKHLEDFRATMMIGGSGGVYDNFVDAFKTFLTTKGHELQKSHLIFDFMELAVHFKSRQKSCVLFPLPEGVGSSSSSKLPPKSKDLPNLSDIQMAGIKMVVRYGCLLRVFPVGSEGTPSQGLSVVETQLMTLLQQCKWVLMRHHSSSNDPASTSLKYLSNEGGGGYPGHDWLASTVFLLAGGQVERSMKFLLSLAPLLAGGYLWLPYLSHGPPQTSTGGGSGGGPGFPAEVRESGIHPLFFNTCHLVEMLVRIELPRVSNAIKM